VVAYLQHLCNLGIPIIATGYGAYMEKMYEFDKSIIPDRAGVSSALPAASLIESNIESFWLAPGGVFWTADAFHEVGKYRDLQGRSIAVHFFPVEKQAGFLQEGCDKTNNGAGFASSVDTVCSDINGTAFLANKVGYALQLASKNPFSYCDDPRRGMCNTNDVVMLMEPIPRAMRSHVPDPLARLFHETILKSIACIPDWELSQCLERNLHVNPLEADPLFRELIENEINIDAFFDRAVPLCGGVMP